MNILWENEKKGTGRKQNAILYMYMCVCIIKYIFPIYYKECINMKYINYI